MNVRWRSVRREAVRFLSLVGVLFVARASFADHYRVPTGSMEPTVLPGDQVCVNKLAYGLRVPGSELYLGELGGPARGDVVVLDSPENGDVLLKRVVAIPGDMVTVEGGRVLIDGVAAPVRITDAGLVETNDGHTHALSTDFGGGPRFGPARVPPRRYLVLGDNRGNSADGRFFGWVERSAILGHAFSVCARGGVPSWRPL